MKIRPKQSQSKSEIADTVGVPFGLTDVLRGAADLFATAIHLQDEAGGKSENENKENWPVVIYGHAGCCCMARHRCSSGK